MDQKVRGPLRPHIPEWEKHREAKEHGLKILYHFVIQSSKPCRDSIKRWSRKGGVSKHHRVLTHEMFPRCSENGRQYTCIALVEMQADKEEAVIGDLPRELIVVYQPCLGNECEICAANDTEK